MALVAALVGNGQQHAITTGTIDAGAGSGQIAAAGANQLMLLTLPFGTKSVREGAAALFENQFYVLAVATDPNVTGVRLDAQQFQYAANGVATLRLRVDANALPAAVTLWLEAHHSIGR